MELTVRGAGGGGGGGSGFTTRPDTLRSNDTFEGVLGLCIGPIKGPVNGIKSLKIFDTPIEDASGNENFKDFTALIGDGDPLKFPQKVVLRLGSAGAPVSVGVQLRNIGGTNSTWATRTVTSTNADALDLRFDVSQLYREDKNGIYGTKANVEIQMKPVGSTTWINPLLPNGNTPPDWQEDGYNIFNVLTQGAIRVIISRGTYDRNVSNSYGSYLTIDGKTTSTFIKEVRVQVPNAGAYADKGWDIRCRLVETESLDADPNFEKRTISWESVTAVFSDTLGDHEDWRGVAWLQIYGKASDNFNGIPDVDGVYDTKIVSVPPSTVYNPDARTYTGAIWDGSWAKAYTNDPAWVINDAISDPLAGIARLVPGAHLNKWDALELSKYCSELVPDGAGGWQPRFSLNLAVTEPQRSDDFIRYLAGACGATAWDNGDGEWRTAVDKPQAPSALYTYENIDGEFNYSHTDIDTRFNDVTITFLNEELEYQQDQVQVTDPDHIAKFGRKPTKVVGVGCTNRQQAVRWAIRNLRTNINEFRQVNFTTNRQGKMLERFQWILVADQSLNQTVDDIKRTSGRLVQNKGGSIVLRDTIRIETGIAYTIALTVPNPAYDPDTTTAPTDPTWQQPTITITRNVTNSNAQCGDVREIFLDSALPANVATNANVALSATGLPSVPKVYRVVDLDYNDDGERVTVSAIEVDTGKFDASDMAEYDYHMPGYDGTGGIVLMPVAPPEGVLSILEKSDPTQQLRVLTASWQRPPFGAIKGYRVSRRVNGGPWIDVGFTTEMSVEVMNPEAGTHEFDIYTIDNHNRRSMPLNATLLADVFNPFTPVGVLTNESATVAASNSGALANGALSNAGGFFEIYTPGGQLASGVTYSVASTTGGAAATIDATGAYTITALTSDSGTVTFQAVWGGFALTKVYTITKSKGGADAKLLTIISDRQTIAYDTTGTPAANQTTTFTAKKQNTTAAVSWSITDIAGVAQAIGNLSAATGDSVTMTEAHFATARNGTPGVIVKATLTDNGVTLSDQISVVRVADGSKGDPGAAALNTAQVLLYQRAVNAPAVPAVTTTYSFVDGSLTGNIGLWSRNPPASNGNPLWVTAATASAPGNTDDILTANWAAPVIMTSDGINNATVFLYKRSSTVPTVPSVTSTYTFASGLLAGQDGGWTQSIPAANGYSLYCTTASALASGATDTIATGEWAAPALVGIDTSDDTLSVADKKGGLIKFAADMQARYRALWARAHALGISTTAAETARANWLNLLASYSPAWNNTQLDTTIYTHLFPDKNFPASWTATNVTTVANGSYTTVSDNDAANRGNIQRQQPIPAIAKIYSGAVAVAKLTAQPTVFPRYSLIGSVGGTPVTGGFNFDAFNGTIGGASGFTQTTVLDLGSEWLFEGYLTSDAGNTSITSRLEPAFNANFTSAAGDPSLQNSIDVLGYPLCTVGGPTKLGHHHLTGTLNAYSDALTALASAVSQLDGATSVVIDPINDIVVHADSTGTIKTGELPLNISVTASMGTSDATPLGTWSLGSLTGLGVSATIGANTGVVRVTAMTLTDVTIPVKFVYAGVTRNGTIHVTVQNDPPAPSGGSTGTGGSTSSTYPTSTSNVENTNGQSYDLTYATACSDIISCVAGSGGKVTVNAPVSFRAVDGASTVNTYGKWRWRVAGGSASSFQDVVGEVACSSPGSNMLLDPNRNVYKYISGQLTVNQTKTGLTPGSVYEFIFVWRDDGVRAYKTTGTLSATGS